MGATVLVEELATVRNLTDGTGNITHLNKLPLRATHLVGDRLARTLGEELDGWEAGNAVLAGDGTVGVIIGVHLGNDTV